MEANINTKNWEVNFKNVGTLLYGNEYTITFQATGNIPVIQKMKSSCGCSKPTYDEKTKILTVLYRPKKIPKNKTKEGRYRTIKSVTLTYVDGKREQLKFKALIIKPR